MVIVTYDGKCFSFESLKTHVIQMRVIQGGPVQA